MESNIEKWSGKNVRGKGKEILPGVTPVGGRSTSRGVYQKEKKKKKMKIRRKEKKEKAIRPNTILKKKGW